MGLHDALIGLVFFFSVLNTITVGLRIFVRTSLTKGAFGWDDVALVFTYVSFEYQTGDPEMLLSSMVPTCRG